MLKSATLRNNQRIRSKISDRRLKSALKSTLKSATLQSELAISDSASNTGVWNTTQKYLTQFKWRRPKYHPKVSKNHSEVSIPSKKVSKSLESINTIQKYLSQFKCLWPKYHPVLKGYTQYRYGLVIHAPTRGGVQWKKLGLSLCFVTPTSVKFQHHPWWSSFILVLRRFHDNSIETMVLPNTARRLRCACFDVLAISRTSE